MTGHEISAEATTEERAACLCALKSVGIEP